MQTAKNKKPKAKRVSKNKPTAHEQEYLEWIHTKPFFCFRCGGLNGIEWHHVKKHSSDKKNHLELIPLCGIECHRLGKESVHGNPRFFREMFPMDMQRRFAKKIYQRFLNEHI
jgi:hypothetical protein